MALKEHLGNDPTLFRVPVEWAKDHSFAVKITHFDASSLDTPEDLLKEAILEKQPIGPIIDGLVAERMESERSEIVTNIIAIIIKSSNKGLAAMQLAFAAGLLITADKTGPAIAKEWGISKQAFFAGVERMRQELGLKQTRTMRDAAARQNMSKRNYRKPKEIKVS